MDDFESRLYAFCQTYKVMKVNRVEDHSIFDLHGRIQSHYRQPDSLVELTIDESGFREAVRQLALAETLISKENQAHRLRIKNPGLMEAWEQYKTLEALCQD